jgi:hypothetical protein
MAVVKWLHHPPRNFPPPKTASFRAWYKAARKVLPSLPEWDPRLEREPFHKVDEQTLIFELGAFGTVFIARKANLP